MLRNLCLTLAYDGTRYSGWQVQPDRMSVQEAVEDAIADLTGQRVSVLSAGRTDAGVHALGQVINFFIENTIPTDRWALALQTRLPYDIVVKSVREVPMDFHATYAARTKRYRYVIRESRFDDPFLRAYCWRVNGPLLIEPMQECARMLIGTHDFRSYESHWPNTGSSVRTVHDARLVRTGHWGPWGAQAVQSLDSDHSLPDTDQDRYLIFEIVGNGFLYNMVRTIVGSLVPVGRGRWTVDEFRASFEALDRSKAGETAPAQGLYLADVQY